MNVLLIGAILDICVPRVIWKLQQVTCRMAFVSSGFSRSSSIALAVDSMSNWTWRRLASFFTSSMTGRAPVPVPPAFPRDLFLRRKRRVAETLPEFLGGLLLTLADLPAIDEHIVLVSDAVDADRTERERFEAAAAGESPTVRFHCLHCFYVASLNAI